MSRFERFSRVTPWSRYQALIRSARYSAILTLILLLTLASTASFTYRYTLTGGDNRQIIRAFWVPEPAQATDHISRTPVSIPSTPMNSTIPEIEPIQPEIEPADPQMMGAHELEVMVDSTPDFSGTYLSSLPLEWENDLPTLLSPSSTKKINKHQTNTVSKQSASQVITPKTTSSDPRSLTNKPSQQSSTKNQHHHYTQPAYHIAPKPPYPPTLRQQGIEGSLKVRISISDQGKPTSVIVISSSGYAEFDTSTCHWILNNWRFTPATRSGAHVASAVVTTIHYVLD